MPTVSRRTLTHLIAVSWAIPGMVFFTLVFAWSSPLLVLHMEWIPFGWLRELAINPTLGSRIGMVLILSVVFLVQFFAAALVAALPVALMFSLLVRHHPYSAALATGVTSIVPLFGFGFMDSLTPPYLSDWIAWPLMILLTVAGLLLATRVFRHSLQYIAQRLPTGWR